jgi:hypothetical protein
VSDQTQAPPGRPPFDPARLVGLSEADAGAHLEALGLALRVMAEDGLALLGTMDFRTDRVNVAVEDGRVVRVISLG